jgi:hypothetical protein
MLTLLRAKGSSTQAVELWREASVNAICHTTFRSRNITFASYHMLESNSSSSTRDTAMEKLKARGTDRRQGIRSWFKQSLELR